MAIAAPRQSVGPTTQLSLEYQSVGNHFWKAKNQLKKQTPTFRTLLAVPLAKNNPAYIEYSRVIISADAFLKIADENNIQTWMIDPVLYFGGLAHFTLGNYSQAAEMFARLSPDYKRNVYINDRDPVNPAFSVPTRPGISKLLFYCRLQTLPDKPADAFSVLQQITTEALKTLTAQQEYAFALANKRSIHDRRDFVESEFGGEPDQIRAAALPGTAVLIETAWDKVLEGAIRKNARGTRDYLRSLAAPGGNAQLAMLASAKLKGLDARIIRSYFAQAQSLLKANNFDKARAKYRQIIAEYPDTPDARRAEAQFPKVTQLAVKFYKAEGEKHFQPAKQVGVPQTKSREYFEKLLKEDPSSDFALYYYSRALATENKLPQALAQIRRFETNHPNSPLRASALFLQGFLLASGSKPDYKRAVTLMDRVAKEFPQSDEAPEALFYAGTYLAWQNQFPQAIARLSQVDNYPKSRRYKWAKPLAERLQQKLKDGTQWP